MSRTANSKRFKSAVFNTKMNDDEVKLNLNLLIEAKEYNKNQQVNIPSTQEVDKTEQIANFHNWLTLIF